MTSSFPVVPIDTTGINVVTIDTTKKRGRPVSGSAMTQAERDRRHRAKKAFLRAAANLRAAGLIPQQVLNECLH